MANKETDRDICIVALGNVFAAIKGCKIFERFEFNMPLSAKVGKAFLWYQYEEGVFAPKQVDWLKLKNEMALSGYEPF